MNDNRKAVPTEAANDRSDKKAWSTPTLTRLEASHAEVGTRAADDGTFTTS